MVTKPDREPTHASEARPNCQLKTLRNPLTGVNLRQRCVQQAIISRDHLNCIQAVCAAHTTMLPALQQAVGQQGTCWLLNSYALRQQNRHNHNYPLGQCGLRRWSHNLRARQQLIGHGTGQFATRVSAAASIGSASYSSNTSAPAAHQQYVQHPAGPQGYPITAAGGPGAVTVTWTGLLAALGLAATALVAAATTCFFLYIKPVVQVGQLLHPRLLPETRAAAIVPATVVCTR